MSRSRYQAAADGLPARVSGSWAIEKLTYVEKYMHIFSGGMKNKWPRRVYLDLLAGPGRCVFEDGTETDGSPLRALRVRPPFTQVIAVEADARLEQALRARTDGAATLTIVQGDCNDSATLARLRAAVDVPDTLSLAFVDLLGTDVDFTTIRALTIGRPVDVIVTFQVNDMARNVGAALDGPQRERFDAFFGTNAWATVAQEGRAANRRPGDIASDLVDVYGRQLEKIGYACVVPLHRLMKTDTDAPLYRLILATKHPRGMDFFRKITRIEASGQRGLF